MVPLKRVTHTLSPRVYICLKENHTCRLLPQAPPAGLLWKRTQLLTAAICWSSWALSAVWQVPGQPLPA